MHKIVNPQQTLLFDPFGSVLTEKTRKCLLDGWPGVFRHVILELMPVDAVSGCFDPIMGRPTKELYSMAGLILIMEFMDWTPEQTFDAGIKFGQIIICKIAMFFNLFPILA